LALLVVVGPTVGMLAAMRCCCLLVVALLVVGCREDPPLPLERGRVIAAADALLVHRGQLDWGPVSHVWPAMVGVDGRRWWQVDYGHVVGVERAVVLVDGESGWARFARPDEALRLRVDVETGQRGPAAGTWIWLVDGEETRTPDQLNELAIAAGWQPLFSWRPQREQRSQLIYGWNGDAGVARERALDRALERWALSGQWLDLAAEPGQDLHSSSE
jgi:hypothetical protein